MVEADAVGDLEVVRRIERDALVPLRQRDRPQHLQVAPRRRQPLDARLVQDQIHERRGAAVHDRHFGVVQLDDDVVDAEGGQGGEQVLDRLDRHGLARQAGLILNAAQVRDGGRNLEPAKIASLEPDAVVGRRRLQRQGDLVAGMKSDSGAGDRSAKGALSAHDLFTAAGKAASELSKGPATESNHGKIAVSD